MKKTPPVAVSYLRVSTRKQGDSGLGIDAQRAAVDAYCRRHGLELLEEYAEIESGGSRASRPRLSAAIDHALGTGAVLVIAKLDRLSRSWRFLDELLDDGDLRFVALDLPEANRHTLLIFASIAEIERDAISARTKAAMAAAKARGKVFGNPANLTAAGKRKGAAVTNGKKLARRDRREAKAGARILYLKHEGFSFEHIARILTNERLKTAHGKGWDGKAVWRTWKRLRGRKTS